MKKYFLFALTLTLSIVSFSQTDEEYRKFVESYKNGVQKMKQDEEAFKAKANAEFAEFVAKEWRLFEEFKAEQLSMNTPKPKEIPTAETAEDAEDTGDGGSSEVEYTRVQKLPAVTGAAPIGEKLSSLSNTYVIRRRISDDKEKSAIQTLTESSIYNNRQVSSESMLDINFYGCELRIPFDGKLRLTASGYKEKDVADYIEAMSENSAETKALWDKLTETVDDLGLNEWGYYCLLRSVADKVFEKDNDKVLFCFYMLRNEGDFKTRIARGKDTGDMTLLIAIDNKLEVYSYSFFRLNDENNTPVKYYTVFGGNGKEAVYSYDFCKQDASKKQMSLDFYKNLNMGRCDISRTLKLTKDKTLTLPYNSAHIAYLNDVPMTMFPIYFASPISIEAQNTLTREFTELQKENTPYQFISILLHFVQTAFDYQTDDEQFGYEKYFYPEEVIAYPYSDCEDRSSLFSWLVTTYTDAKVIGLQYEGHVATAVCFGDGFSTDGDSFSYGGKRYYVCDPTYINASVGMTMPQFIGKTPKVIKLKKAAN